MEIHSLILSTADWNRPVWTNKQYVARELARIGPVTYVDSLGLRRPTASRADLRRLLLRLTPGNTIGTGPRTADGVTVKSPWVIPWHRRSTPTWHANRASLRRTARGWLASPPRARVLWTFSPVTYGLEKDASLVVYHCVDILEHFTGVDHRALREGEAALRQLPGLTAVASSTTVASHLADNGFDDPAVWENVADVELIEDAARESERRANHVVFAGNLSLQKVDFDMMRRLVAANPGIQLHLAGPVAEGGGPRPDLGWFQNHPRVELHGVLAPKALGQLLGSCGVGLIPYIRSPYTDGVFPMKVYEYLAAGLAVVSTDLPALEGIGHVAACDSDSAFQEAVLSHIESDDASKRKRRVRIARRHSWAGRGRQIHELIADRLDEGSGHG